MGPFYLSLDAKSHAPVSKHYLIPTKHLPQQVKTVGSAKLRQGQQAIILWYMVHFNTTGLRRSNWTEFVFTVMFKAFIFLCMIDDQFNHSGFVYAQ